MKRLTIILLFLSASAAAQPVPREVLIANDHFCASGSSCRTYRFGYNPEVSPGGGFELLSRTGEDHVLGFSDTIFSLASTSANDTATGGGGGGSGARRVIVGCFNHSADFISEIVTMDGQTPVAMTSLCQTPVSLQVQAPTGTNGGANEGTVWIGTGAFVGGVPASKHGQIPAPDGGLPVGQSQMALHVVRTGMTGCLSSLEVKTDGGGEVILRALFEPFFTSIAIEQFSAIAGTTPLNLEYPLCFPEGTVIAVYGRKTIGPPFAMGVSLTFLEFESSSGTLRTSLHANVLTP